MSDTILKLLDQMRHSMPVTPQEHIDDLERYRKVLSFMMAESDRRFCIVLRHPTKSDYQGIYCVAVSSFGYYVGSIINAFTFISPVELTLNGFLLPDNSIPIPDMMLIRHACKLTFDDTARQLEEWKSKL